MVSKARINRISHHQWVRKALVFISHRVTAGRSVPSSAKAEVKAGTATTMMMANTMMAVTMTMTG